MLLRKMESSELGVDGGRWCARNHVWLPGVWVGKRVSLPHDALSKLCPMSTVATLPAVNFK